MASDERCPVCDRVLGYGSDECDVEPNWATYNSHRAYDEAVQRCHERKVDWRARALAAEAQRDSLESALAAVTNDRDHERRVANEWLSQLHDGNKSIAELKSTLAAVTSVRDELFRETQRAQGVIDDAKRRIDDAERSCATACRNLAVCQAQRAELEATVERMRRVLEWLDRGGGLGFESHRRILDALVAPPAAPVVGDAAELLQSANLGRVSNMSAQCARCPRTVVVAMTHAGPVLCATCIDAAPVRPMAKEGRKPSLDERRAGLGWPNRPEDRQGVDDALEMVGVTDLRQPFISPALLELSDERAAIEAEVEARVVEEVAAYFDETHDIVSGMPVTVLMGDIADDVRAGKWRTK